MKTALVIGLIFSVIDILVFAIICFWVNYSKISFEEKKDFYKRLFWSGPKQTIKLIIFVVILNLFVEYFIFAMVFYLGPKSWRKYELESTKVYYSGERFNELPIGTLVFEEDETSEEKQYIIVVYEEKIVLTDKAPFKGIFDLLKTNVKTGNVEYHITSVY